MSHFKFFSAFLKSLHHELSEYVRQVCLNYLILASPKTWNYHYLAFVWPFWPLWPWKPKICEYTSFYFQLMLKSKKIYENLMIFNIRPLLWPSKSFWPFFNFSGLLKSSLTQITQIWVNYVRFSSGTIFFHFF